MPDSEEKFGRRAEDKFPLPEKTWQEAAVNNRKLIQEIGEDYRRFAKRITFILIFMAVVIVVSLIREQNLISDNSKRVSDIQRIATYEAQVVAQVKRLATATASAVNGTASAVNAIQEQRVSACRDTNQRYFATVHRIDFAIAHASDAAQHQQALRNRKVTLSIIRALEPPRNCSNITKGK